MPEFSLRARLWAEGLGTYFLVFAGTGAIVIDGLSGGRIGHLGIGLVFGLAVLALIQTFGPVSGAHFNPAVTLGFLATGRHPLREAIPYTLAQLAGAVLASMTIKFIFGTRTGSWGGTIPSGTIAESFFLKLLMTALLLLTILRSAGSAIPGLGIGAVVGLEAVFGGPISGASMNPARSFGPALAGLDFSAHWVYWAAPAAGALLAAGLEVIIRPSTEPACGKPRLERVPHACGCSGRFE